MKRSFSISFVEPGPDGLPQVYYMQDGFWKKTKTTQYLEGNTGNAKNLKVAIKDIRKFLKRISKI